MPPTVPPTELPPIEVLPPTATTAPPPTAVPPTAVPPTPVPPTAVPPTAPSLPGSVVDSGVRPNATGVYNAPYYTVASGDTLFSIAQRFGVSVAQITAANNIVNNAIFPGQQLLISSGSAGSGGPGNIPFERVNFPAGGISATLNGLIVQGQPKGYVLNGAAGRVMEIGTTSNGEPLLVTVHTANGQTLSLQGENGLIANNLFVPLPATGDYYVTIAPTITPENPNLAFTVTFIIQ